MVNLQAVFWDLDGTLADTELEGHRRSFNEAFAQFGLDVHWDIGSYIDLLRHQGGVNRIISFAKSNHIDLNLNDARSIHKLKQNIYTKKIFSGQIPLRNGVQRLVNELSERQICQLIVTSSGRMAAKALIDSKFCTSRRPFAGLIAFEDVINHKPHPEPYLKAVELAGIPKQNIICIEDSLAGLTSARAAGLQCILTLPSWNKVMVSEMYPASAVLSQIGNPAEGNNGYFGPKCIKGFVDYDYLESLLNKNIE